MLGDLPVSSDDRVLVDYRTADDAGVYRLDAERALVQTVDFFTPIVDDPYVYGEIAAANALSDVYAMGGRPLTALAVAGFPKEFEHAVLKAIFAGGVSKLQEAGVALLGGHTVQDLEVKFGYAVTGEVRPDRVWSNAGARPERHAAPQQLAPLREFRALGPVDQARLAATLILLALAYLLGGTSGDFPGRAMVIELAAIGLLALTLATWRGPRPSWAAIAGIVFILALPLLQLVPLPPKVWQLLPGRQVAREIAIFADPAMWRPVTLDASARRSRNG